MGNDGSAKATQATGQPSYPTEMAAYGFECKTHDLGYDDCNVTAGADVAAGQPYDWCASQWCKVDPDNCEFRSLHISYTGQENDFFSYETCGSCGGLAGCPCIEKVMKATQVTDLPNITY